MALFSIKDCNYCGNKFSPVSSGNRYCSHHCRFMDIAVPFNGVDGCWEWQRSINPQTGYGQFMTRENKVSKLLTAHRLSYEIFRGHIPNGLDVCHTCDNRKCFNPAHLFVGTAKDNISDMFKKGRNSDRTIRPNGWIHPSILNPENLQRGNIHHAARLSDDIVREIRKSQETSTSLAKRYGVSISTLSAARRGKTWQHV